MSVLFLDHLSMMCHLNDESVLDMSLWNDNLAINSTFFSVPFLLYFLSHITCKIGAIGILVAQVL